MTLHVYFDFFAPKVNFLQAADKTNGGRMEQHTGAVNRIKGGCKEWGNKEWGNKEWGNKHSL